MSRSATALLLLCLASPLLADERPQWLAMSDNILSYGNAASAEAFLSSKLIQDQLKTQNPQLFLNTFERATELKDLRDLLLDAADEDVIRLGLSSRPDCAFCQNLSKMKKWAAREIGPDEITKLETVYWDWKTLDDSQSRWLSAHGMAPDQWDGLEFGSRRARLQGWAMQEAKTLMAFNPTTREEFSGLSRRYHKVAGILGSAGRASLDSHIDQVRTIVDKIVEAKKMLAQTNNPGLISALKEAQTAATTETRLAALERIFDGLGHPDAAILAAIPARRGQSFDANSRRLVAGIIASGVMRETRGTWAGQELQYLYAKRPLHVAVAPMDHSIIADYDDDKITFNETFIAEYVKSQGRTLNDLTKDPKLAKSLIYAILPTFVHEATHQSQDAWAKKQGIPFWSGEGVEVEAIIAAGVFLLQKSKNDPSYRSFLLQNKDAVPIVREELAKANRLRMDGAAAYGPKVMSTHYPEYLSISANAWSDILSNNDIAGIVRKEIARRDKLPKAERAALEKLPYAQEDYESANELEESIGTFGTAQLRGIIAKQQKASRISVAAYAKFSERLQSAEMAADNHLRELDAQTDKVPGEVPPPSK